MASNSENILLALPDYRFFPPCPLLLISMLRVRKSDLSLDLVTQLPTSQSWASPGLPRRTNLGLFGPSNHFTQLLLATPVHCGAGKGTHLSIATATELEPERASFVRWQHWVSTKNFENPTPTCKVLSSELYRKAEVTCLWSPFSFQQT